MKKANPHVPKEVKSMPAMLNDLKEAMISKAKCLMTSSVYLLKYMAIILVPLYVIYLFMN